VTHSPHLIIEGVAWPKPIFVVVVPSAVLSKKPLVLVVISTRILALILIELSLLLLTLATILVSCHSSTACQSQQRRRTSSHPPSCLPKFPPSHTWFSILKSWIAEGVSPRKSQLCDLYRRLGIACQFNTAQRVGQNCSFRRESAQNPRSFGVGPS
jgi:hypothetical protein